MINRNVLDQVEEAIDSFEENWSPDSRGNIKTLLEAYELTSDPAALTELIRIDIELRYKHGVTVQLDDYFQDFGDLLHAPDSVAQIAFEDYRSRSAGGAFGDRFALGESSGNQGRDLVSAINLGAIEFASDAAHPSAASHLGSGSPLRDCPRGCWISTYTGDR